MREELIRIVYVSNGFEKWISSSELVVGRKLGRMMMSNLSGLINII